MVTFKFSERDGELFGPSTSRGGESENTRKKTDEIIAPDHSSTGVLSRRKRKAAISRTREGVKVKKKML